jgi:hypothetical protein
VTHHTQTKNADVVTARPLKWLAFSAALVTGSILGCLGSILQTPGGSLAIPTLEVFALGIGLAVIAWVFALMQTRQRWRRIYPFWMTVVSIIAAVWTFQFSLPASLSWDSGATAQANSILSHLHTEAQKHNGIAPHEPCTLQTTGSIGPLAAPYRQCAVWTPEGHVVTFTTVGSGTPRGLSYSDAGAEPGGDSCRRHLEGGWWMFREPSDTGGDPGQCPIGYKFQGV